MDDDWGEPLPKLNLLEAESENFNTVAVEDSLIAQRDMRGLRKKEMYELFQK